MIVFDDGGDGVMLAVIMVMVATPPVRYRFKYLFRRGSNQLCKRLPLSLPFDLNCSVFSAGNI